MKKRVLWIISILIFILGIGTCFVKPHNFEYNYVIENVLLGISSILIAIIISPLYNLLFKNNNRNIIFEKINNILIILLSYYYLLYLAQFQTGYSSYACIGECNPLENEIAYIIIIITSVIIIFYNLLVIKIKSLNKIKIINIITILIYFLLYLSLKTFYINYYNKQSKNMEVSILESKAIEKKQVSNKYYFGDFYVENLYDNYEKNENENSISLKNDADKKYISFIKSDDPVNKVYNSIDKKEPFIKTILLYKYMINNNISSIFEIAKYHSKNKQLNIFDSTNNIFYNINIIIPSFSGGTFQEIKCGDLKLYLQYNNYSDKNRNIYALGYYDKENLYIWRFIGDFNLDDIYDFISTLNIEEENNKENNENTITENSENSAEAIAYCENNIDTIYNKINEMEKSSFIVKYFPEDMKYLTKDQIDCKQTSYISEKELYIIRYDNEPPYIYNVDTNEVEAYNDSRFNNIYDLEAFVYAKNITSEDREIYEKSHSDNKIGTFPDNNYNGGDKYVLKICSYTGEEEYCPDHYYDYEINFKDRTFKRINIDVE